jgi:hypothetical protein
MHFKIVGRVTNDMKLQFVICIANKGCSASLELRKIYQVIPDKNAGELNQKRVIDESGEDYLYPADFFVPVQLPRAVEAGGPCFRRGLHYQCRRWPILAFFARVRTSTYTLLGFGLSLDVRASHPFGQTKNAKGWGARRKEACQQKSEPLARLTRGQHFTGSGRMLPGSFSNSRECVLSCLSFFRW